MTNLEFFLNFSLRFSWFNHQTHPPLRILLSIQCYQPCRRIPHSRTAPCAKWSRVWARWMSSRRSPVPAKSTVCSPGLSPARRLWMPIAPAGRGRVSHRLARSSLPAAARFRARPARGRPRRYTAAERAAARAPLLRDARTVPASAARRPRGRARHAAAGAARGGLAVHRTATRRPTPRDRRSPAAAPAAPALGIGLGQ